MSQIKFFEELYDTLKQRKIDLPKNSYSTKLFKKGRDKIAQKLGEEAVELVIEAIKNDKEEAIKESSDLVFHLIALLVDMDISFDDIIKELKKREGVSGLEEKKSRKET